MYCLVLHVSVGTSEQHPKCAVLTVQPNGAQQQLTIGECWETEASQGSWVPLSQSLSALGTPWRSALSLRLGRDPENVKGKLAKFPAHRNLPPDPPDSAWRPQVLEVQPHMSSRNNCLETEVHLCCLLDVVSSPLNYQLNHLLRAASLCSNGNIPISLQVHGPFPAHDPWPASSPDTARPPL